jgi:hypothetical protein
MRKLLIVMSALILFSACKQATNSKCQCYYLDHLIGRYSTADSLYTLSSPPNKAPFSDQCALGKNAGYNGTSFNGIHYYEFGYDTGFGNSTNIPITCH